MDFDIVMTLMAIFIGAIASTMVLHWAFGDFGD